MKVIAIDTETGLITDTCKAPPMVCLSYAYLEAGEVVTGLVHWPDAPELLLRWLHDPDVLLVGQNIAYDFGVVCAEFPSLTQAVWEAYRQGGVDDTKLREQLLDIADGTKDKRKYSLEALAKKYLSLDLDKDTWRLRYIEFRDVPVQDWPVSAQDYPKKDAEATLRVYLEQDKRKACLDDSVRQTRAAWWIHLMAAWGIRTDVERVARMGKETQAEYDRLEALLKSEGLVRPRSGSRNTKAAQGRMLDLASAKGKEAKLTATGNVSLDKEACAEAHDEVLSAYAELSAIKTVLTKDVPVLRAGQIHSRFEPLLSTGRTSSSSPNIQNLRRKGGARECFVPREGFVFVDADYSVIELRTFAQVCKWAVGSSRLADRINAGFDPHLDLGAQLLGIAYDEAEKRLAADDAEVQEARQRAKPANFGYPGGMGAKTFAAWTKQAYNIVLTDDQALELRNRWFANWPEAGAYFAWINSRTAHRWTYSKADDGDVVQVKSFVSNRYRGGCFYTEACNSYFQGLAADIGKAAGFAIAQACYDRTAKSVLYGSRIVNFIHDEFIVEVPENVAHDCALEVGRLMVKSAEPFIPDVPAKCEPVLCRRWSKKAKAVWQNGKLVPWDEK